MNKNLLSGLLAALVLVCAAFAGYYFAVAVPAREQATLALEQQRVAAQAAKATAQASQAKLEAQKQAAEEAAAQAKRDAEGQAESEAQQAAQEVQDAKDQRSAYLASCQRKAENDYWVYVKLNGTPAEGQLDVYNAPQYVWDRATAQKKERLDECFRLVDSGVNPDDLEGTLTPLELPNTQLALYTDDSAAFGITDEEVNRIVVAYLAAGELSDPASALNMYADNVTYFKQGLKPKSFLYADKSAYFKRWPSRTYSLASQVATLSDGGLTRQVRFDYDYRVERPGKTLAGRAYTVLGLERLGSELAITSETGEVYKQ
ncbi:hypothetical protein E7T06_06130 [Deinococcus sp. Arct2-2]|uniref:hypothetical protein n=1 Tax=Deinococcus sp. Arct2-2 TaxID=2568653 RepID=UPI0010A39AF7|nr:hypothetical protein [Deinococcus sp. Arct2-2]THF70713.1 hypothetical protein E7T06_06130 [Deinococcus sp. Arct2-2]